MTSDENNFNDARGDDFYSLIAERYGKHVEKILRFLDLDDMKVLSKIKSTEITSMFEKSNDNNATTDELIALKKEVCVTIDGEVTLKLGIKNKLGMLAKCARSVMREGTKTRKSAVRSSTSASTESDGQRTSSSATANHSSSSDPDDGTDLERHRTVVVKAISKLLSSRTIIIHGVPYTHLTAKDFKIIFDQKDEFDQIQCLVECSCGHRVKLFMRTNKFQLSNFLKHIRSINGRNVSKSTTDDASVSSDSDVISEEDDGGRDDQIDAPHEEIVEP